MLQQEPDQIIEGLVHQIQRVVWTFAADDVGVHCLPVMLNRRLPGEQALPGKIPGAHNIAQPLLPAGRCPGEGAAQMNQPLGMRHIFAVCGE
ncbi:hypothetical protein D3C73_1448600 [compost metagenome]